MVGKTNSTLGGGFSLEKPFIHVRTSVNSTIEFVRNNILVKTLYGRQGFAEPDGIHADYYYSPSQTGIYTITAIKGMESASATIEVTSNKEYDVTLPLKFYIFRQGKIINMPTLYSYNGIDMGTLSEITESSVDYVYWYRKFSTYTISAAYYTVDVTKYAKAGVDLYAFSNYRYNTQTNTPAICLADAPFSGETNGAWNNVLKFNLWQTGTNRTTISTPTTYKIDISSYSGSKCVFISMGGTTNEDSYQKITNFYLEE